MLTHTLPATTPPLSGIPTIVPRASPERHRTQREVPIPTHTTTPSTAMRKALYEKYGDMRGAGAPSERLGIPLIIHFAQQRLASGG